MLDRKGIASYLLITFVLTYAIEGALFLSGIRFDQSTAGQYAGMIIAGVMWVPALATWITIRFVTHENFRITRVKFGSWKPYLATAMIIPLCFGLIYALTWLFGLGHPEWGLESFLGLMASAGADMSDVPAGQTLLVGIFFTTLLITPFINSIFGFGEELGWRGYLLTKLMPLGKWPAYLVLGVIWGLWHAPLMFMGFLGPVDPFLALLAMIGLTTSLGIFINEITLRYRSSLLAGWIHGVFNSQSYGIWRVLFPDTALLLGGMNGLIGLGVWLALGLLTMKRLQATTGSPQTH